MLGGHAGVEEFLAELSRRFRRVREEYGTFAGRLTSA
jgi:hypothetical protein